MATRIGTLLLSDEDAAEYQSQYDDLVCKRNHFTSQGHDAMVKKYKQRIGFLYQKYFHKQVAPELSDWEKENALSLEDRIKRIEKHLKLGHYKEG